MKNSKQFSVAALSLVMLSGIVATVFSTQGAAKPVQNLKSSSGEILFISSPPNQKPSIYAIRGDGSGLRKISRQPLGCIGATWSPDKKSIVMALATKIGTAQKRDVWRYNLALMDVKSGKVRNIQIAGHPNLKTFAPTFAPSGREIIFTGSVRPRFLDLYQVDIKGSQLKRITDDGRGAFGRLNPMGSRIVYSAFRDGRSNVSTMSDGGKNVRRLTNTGVRNEAPDWSFDGKKISFVSDRNGHSQIYIMNADGNAQRQLTKSREENFSPTFSPNGQQIAFARRIGKTEQLYVMNANGTNQRRINAQMNGYLSPNWR